MTNVHPIRPDIRCERPITYLGSGPAILGLLSFFAEDDSRELPRSQDHVIELLNACRDARSSLQDLERRLELEAMR